MAKHTTSIFSLKAAVNAATRPYSGVLTTSQISALLILWVLLINDYAPVQLPWLRPAIQVATVVIVYFRSWDSLPVLSIATILGNIFIYQDKIDHSILSDLIPAFLWVVIRFKDAWVIFFLTAFFFATSGFSKLYGGWLALDTQAARSYVLNFVALGRSGDWAVQSLQSLPRWLWEVFDYATVLFELTWLIVALRPRMALAMIPASAVFHLSTYMLLGINFRGIWVVYLLMITVIRSHKRFLHTPDVVMTMPKKTYAEYLTETFDLNKEENGN